MLYNQKITGMAKVHWTPEGWRCEKKGEHLYRAQWMDYRSPAIQMLTMVTLNRLPLLGELRGASGYCGTRNSQNRNYSTYDAALSLYGTEHDGGMPV